MLLFEFRAIFNVKSAGVAWLPVCPFADNKKGFSPARGHGIISKKRGSYVDSRHANNSSRRVFRKIK
ncbi:hypothetical protein G057_15876 [Klebsiella pneumoniae hvKP1]|nr:hypothetical protein G057_15876 [Klebsiella pneumoniae hvKP1]